MADSINERLARGEMVAVGSKLYAVCATCRSVIQVNKWLFGSLHQCLTQEEIDAMKRQRP